jgi:hypothetical protein
VKLKLTEEQVLAWNDNKDYMDKTKGTEIGSSEPYTTELGKESNQSEAPTEPIHEGESVVYDHPNDQNSPAPGTNQVGDSAPYDKKINEENVSSEDAAGLPDGEEDFSDYPFPEVAASDNDSYGERFHKEFNEFENREGNDNDEYEIEFDDDEFAGNDGLGMRGLENWEEDWNKFDEDDDLDYPYESRKRGARRVNEDKLNDFGKHPAYRKVPMTTPPNKEVAINGAKEWDDKSAQGEQPYGQQIGSSAPYEDVVEDITEAIVNVLMNKKKQ